MSLSGVVLGAQASGAFAPRLQFGAEPAAVAYLEIYDAPKGAALTASFELAASEASAPIATVPATLPAAQGGDLRLAFGAFAIAALPPGDYLVRAIVSLEGKPVARATRTLRKVAP
jgi:hypothetical protein